MSDIIIAGAGWSGCAAAVAAAKQGGNVTLMEKTDMVLGAGNAGGIMRNNGRFTAAEENIALGASELFRLTDEFVLHRNIDFPGHSHASFYDVAKLEPAVRRLLKDMGVKLMLQARAVDVVKDGQNAENNKISGLKYISGGTGGETKYIEGDMFVETTGSSGPMGNCVKYGRGCAMCIQRCPSFGPRVSLTERAGGVDLMGKRADGSFGALSGSCKLEKRSLSTDLIERLERDGFLVLPLPEHLINRKKLQEKVCQQYALDEFAENLILIDAGQVKVMSPFFELKKLRQIEGLENARFEEPMAGGGANSVRYMSVGRRTDYMEAECCENLFLGGEKSGLFVGHTEAITTGSLAGFNAVRKAQGKEMVRLPEELAAGALLEQGKRLLETEEGLYHRLTFAGGEFFDYMKAHGLYSVEPDEIVKKVEALGLLDVYNRQ